MSFPSPLVSCLCVTTGRNPALLQRAVRCFNAQTYSRKELIIVCQKVRGQSHEELTRLASGYPGIRLFLIESRRKIPLGELRNMSVSNSAGEYICQWDDDDWCHNQRIQLQMKFMRQHHKAASVLTNWLMFDAITRTTYMSGPGPWASTLLCERNILADIFRYPPVQRHEDLHMIRRLFTINCIYPLVMPHLYIYVYHGQNTSGKKHFQRLFGKSQKLSAEANHIVTNVLEEKYGNADASRQLSSSPLLSAVDYYHHFLAGLKLKY